MTSALLAVPSERALLIAFVLLGIALRVWQYAGSTSMWVDELALADGILNADAWHLLSAPLPHGQAAAKGFLLLQKLAATVLGPGDHALRLIPCVCSLIAMVAFAWFATRTLDGIGPSTATLLFAVAAPLISFGAQVKQYSTDVCVAVLLWCLACGLVSRAPTTRRAMSAALTGAVLAWFSQPAVLMLVAFGFVIVGLKLSAPGRFGYSWRNVGVLVVGWGISAAAVAAVGLASVSAATNELLLRFWAAGFPPSSLAELWHTRWPAEPLLRFFGSGETASLVYPLPALYAVLALLGLGLVCWRKPEFGALLVAPVMVALVAAAARLYPFSDRLILFLVPAFVIGIAAAVAEICRLAAHCSRSLVGVLAGILIAPTVFPVLAKPPVYTAEDMQPVLSRLHDEKRPGDAIYVYYAAAPAVTFYGPRYGLERDSYRVGGCHRGGSRRYLRELDTYRGQHRFWLVLTHAQPVYREREDILAYLDAIGEREDSFVVESRALGRIPASAELYRYDLSKARKGSLVDADSFAMLGTPSADTRVNCSGPQATVPADFP